MFFVLLPDLTILDVIGRDAAKIVNNLCTANVMTLGPMMGREAFVTDVRGKTVGHVCIFQTPSGLRMIGAGTNANDDRPKQSAAISAHLDRYTLREDATPADISGSLAAVLVDGNLLAKLDSFAAVLVTDPVTCELQSTDFGIKLEDSESIRGCAYRVPWWGDQSVLMLVDKNEMGGLLAHLRDKGGIEEDAHEFHRRRIGAKFPWFGIDIDPSNLPQEADRDSAAISFQKGCYLGQETVARLDALGQVQKRLVLWDLTCQSTPRVNTELKSDDRTVGRLTSVTGGNGANQYIALGFARRSHLDPGSIAHGSNEDGQEIEAVVL